MQRCDWPSQINADLSSHYSHIEVTRPRSEAGSSVRLVTASQQRREDQRPSTWRHSRDLLLLSWAWEHGPSRLGCLLSWCRWVRVFTVKSTILQIAL